MERLFEILNIKEITSLKINFIDNLGNYKEIHIDYTLCNEEENK